MITNEMWQRAKEAFDVCINLNVWYEFDEKGASIPITRKQVEEHFKEDKKQICAVCDNVADYDSVNKEYSDLFRDCKQSEFHGLFTPDTNTADLIKSEVVAFAEWIFYNTYEQRWKDDKRRFLCKDAMPYTSDELYTIYLTSKQAK
jgi:hypothetical protein